MAKEAPLLSVLIADDHKLLTDLLALVLEAELDMKVTFAASFDNALQCINEIGGFDVAMVDLNMPGMAGLDSVLRLHSENDGGSTVIFAGAASPMFIKTAVEGGISGYIPKVTSLKSLPAAIRFVASGGVYVPHAQIAVSPETTSSICMGDGTELTEREVATLRLVAEGRTNKTIAWEIGQSEIIVKMVMRNICSKLGAQNRTQASMIAIRHGLI